MLQRASRLRAPWPMRSAKLAPREQAKNPVMLMVYVSAILTLGLFVLSLFGISDAAFRASSLAISVVLWCTVAVRELRGGARRRPRQGPGRRRCAPPKRDVVAHKLNEGLVAKGSHVDDPAGFFLAQRRGGELGRLEEEATCSSLRAERADSRRRRDRHGCRVGGRKRHHGRVRPGDPRGWRRPLAPLPEALPCFRTGWWCA